MNIGDVVIINSGGWQGWKAIIVDDCFRKTDTRCTMLVKLFSNHEVELELDVEDVKAHG